MWAFVVDIYLLSLIHFLFIFRFPTHTVLAFSYLQDIWHLWCMCKYACVWICNIFQNNICSKHIFQSNIRYFHGLLLDDRHVLIFFLQIGYNIFPLAFAKYIFVLSFASVGSAKYLFEWRGKVLKGFYRVLEVLEKQRTAMCPFCKKKSLIYQR